MATTPKLSDLDRLRLQAEDFWDHQQDSLAKARSLVAEASRQGIGFGRDEVAPRVGRAYGNGVAALGSAIATIQAFRDKQVRDALSTAGRVRVQSPVVLAAAATPRRKSSAGLWIGLGLGAVAAAAVGYLVWQTLRADDDLWIEDVPDTPDLSADA